MFCFEGEQLSTLKSIFINNIINVDSEIVTAITNDDNNNDYKSNN